MDVDESNVMVMCVVMCVAGWNAMVLALVSATSWCYRRGRLEQH